LKEAGKGEEGKKKKGLIHVSRKAQQAGRGGVNLRGNRQCSANQENGPINLTRVVRIRKGERPRKCASGEQELTTVKKKEGKEKSLVGKQQEVTWSRARKKEKERCSGCPKGK